MTRTKAGLLLLVVFLLGGIAGAFAERSFVAYRVRYGGPGPDRMERFMVQRLARRLDLDAAQREVLAKIADRTRGQLAEVRREAMPKVEAILDQAYEELRPSLRPDQQIALERMREETRDRLRARGRAWWWGGGR